MTINDLAKETHENSDVSSLVKRGRWIGKQLDNFRKYQVTCSECGWIGIENFDSYNEPSDFNFCPYCGAKMMECEESNV